MSFRAIRVASKNAAAELAELEDRDLAQGDVTIAVEYSTVNYKDGLALTGRAPVIRRFPLTAGIDLAGRVTASADPHFSAGDRVVVNGWGLGEFHDGGLAQMARVPAAWPNRLPEAIGTKQAAAIGTAGFTAMLSVMALERNGVKPGDGEILVTGASGGVGSVAIALLSGLGYRVTASTGRMEEEGYLKGLGAATVIDRRELSGPGKPLGAARWSGAVDSVGSHTLANVLAETRYGGVVASVGLAQGADLPATVYPFILRGVVLAGINSVEAPHELRDEAWARLASQFDLAKLEAMTSAAELSAAPRIAREILAGRVRGRTVIDVNR